MGGDEFLVLLPECKASELDDIVSRLRGLTMPIGQQSIHVTFSAGAAGYENGETGRQLLERADAALYSDKRSRKISLSAPD